MQAEQLSELSELFRRFHNVIKIGYLWEVDLPGKQVRVKLEGQLITGWLPLPGEVAKNYVRWRPLVIGTNVMIACESGDLRNASIVQIFYGDGDKAPPSDSESLDLIKFIDGAELSYDTDTHKMNIKVPEDGEINILAESSVVNVNANEGEIKATSVNGKIEATATNGEINLSAHNGHIKCESVSGRIDLLTQGGTINATCLQGFNILGSVNVVGSVNCTGSVNAVGNVNSEANVTANSNVTAGGDVSDSTRSMQGDRDIYNVHKHANNGAAPPDTLQ